MNKYEAVIILNPNLSTKVDSFLKEFTSLLSDNSFNIIKTEDVGSCLLYTSDAADEP